MLYFLALPSRIFDVKTGKEYTSSYQEIIPPLPISSFVYKCDNCFHVDSLFPLYKESSLLKTVVALVTITGEECKIYFKKGTQISLEDSIHVYRMNSHKCGGSSSARFGRIVKAQVEEYIKKICSLLNELILKYEKQIAGIILLGHGPIKDQVVNSGWLTCLTSNKIAKVITVSETELKSSLSGSLLKVEECQVALSKIELKEHYEMYEKWKLRMELELEQIVYGGEEMKEAIENGQLKELLVLVKEKEGKEVERAQEQGCTIFRMEDLPISSPLNQLFESYGSIIGYLWFPAEKN